MATETTLPGTIAEDTVVGTTGWSNDNNALTDNGAYAETNAFTTPAVNHYYLTATNYGAAVSGTIDGIEVRNNCRSSGSCGGNLAKFIQGGSIAGNDISPNGSNWPAFASPADRIYGGATEKGGLSWTDTQINASDSGFGISARTANFAKGYVDVLERTVYYTPGGGGGANLPAIMHHRRQQAA